MAGSIILEQSVTMPDGKVWKIFDVGFTDADGVKFSFYIYALSREHASYVVEEIKKSAILEPGDIIDIGKL
ncbi:hypothetical protein ACXGQP_15710 [Enterobacter oligotrophicus]